MDRRHFVLTGAVVSAAGLTGCEGKMESFKTLAEARERVLAHAGEHFLAGHVARRARAAFLARHAHGDVERLEQEHERVGRVAPVLQRDLAQLVPQLLHVGQRW